MSVVGPACANGDAEALKELASKYADICQASGIYNAAKVITASPGLLKEDVTYDFAVDFKGRMLNHPVQDDLRGQGIWELQDAKGRFIVQDFHDDCKVRGSGLV